MARSSPEGIELSKGSNLESFSLSINKEKVLELKQKERSYSEEEVIDILQEFTNEDLRRIKNWLKQFKKK